MRNEEIRNKTGLQKLECTIKERKVRWLQHVLRMEDSRIAIVGAEWLQEKAGATKEKPDGHHQPRSQGHGHYLGRSRTGSKYWYLENGH